MCFDEVKRLSNSDSCPASGIACNEGIVRLIDRHEGLIIWSENKNDSMISSINPFKDVKVVKFSGDRKAYRLPSPSWIKSTHHAQSCR